MDNAPKPVATPLFRVAAATGAAGGSWGRPISALPPSWRLLTIAFSIFAVSIISFLATATVARKETVSGTLAFSLGELRIVPTRAGIVRALYVSEGQEVERDQALAFVSTEQQLASGDVVDKRVLDAINAEQQMLEARLAALNESAPLEQQALAERLRGTRHQIEELAKEIPIRQERLALSHEAAEVGKDAFNRGVMSGDNLRQRQYERLTQEQATDDFKAQIAQLEAQAASDSASLAKLPSDTAQTRAQIQQEIVALEEKRANTSAQNGFILKAPAAGHVTSLQARIGQPVDPSKPLMTVVPTGSDLQAEIYVPSRAIGFVQPGQQVRLFYDAFPHERFGLAVGWIVEVSASVLRPDEVTGSIAVKEPVYRAIVIPEKSSVNAYGTEIPLRSGMSLTADIILEDRSFLKLMLDPLRAAGSRVLGN